MAAAHKFGREEDWPKATLCVLMAQKLDGHSTSSIGAIQRKFSYLGFNLDRDVIAMSLDALDEAGLIGVFHVDPPDELG